jgi:serine/threonine protein kinase
MKIEYSSTSGKQSSGRPSTDGMMSSHEILSQMFCDSPMVKESTKRDDSIISQVSSRVGDIFLMQPTRMRSDRSLTYSPSCHINESSIRAAASFDCIKVETPLPRITQAWGSQPVPGKDWGLSAGCCVDTLNFLLARLEEDCNPHYAPGLNSTYNQQFHLNMSIPLSCSLGFELEENDEGRVENPNNSTIPSKHANVFEIDNDLKIQKPSSLRLRQTSDGCQAFGRLMIDDVGPSPEKVIKRMHDSMNKRFRMSLYSSAIDNVTSICFEHQTKRNFAVPEQLNNQMNDVASSLCHNDSRPSDVNNKISLLKKVSTDETILSTVFGYLNERELFHSVSLVSTTWNNIAAVSYASMIIKSHEHLSNLNDDLFSDDNFPHTTFKYKPFAHRSWSSIVQTYPRGQYLSEGAFKKVFKAWNASVGAEEALSIIDLTKIDEPKLVGTELAIYFMLSSLTRRNICPNFLLIRGVFTSTSEPPIDRWNESSLRACYAVKPTPDGRDPIAELRGQYQYVRMELCVHGDVEGFIRRQPDGLISSDEARIFLFQMAFSLHVAGDQYSLKHNDIKLLNFLLQSMSCPNEHKNPFTTLRYGIGAHIFNLRMKSSRSFVVKLADFGTANIRSECNGEPVNIGNFTTLENSPPEFMILGDAAKQGHMQDSFALGLCMLHLFTGHAPYEVMDTVKCPKFLKKKLTRIWMRSPRGFDVIRSVILGDSCEDFNGETEELIDDTLFDTLYRYLVLFGIPDENQQMKDGSRVWNAINSCLLSQDYPPRPSCRPTRKVTTNKGITSDNDTAQFKKDLEMFSLMHGKNIFISRAREKLESIDGALDVLFSLVNFDPSKRASPLDVVNSQFMLPLRQLSDKYENDADILYSYMAYSVYKPN